MDSVFPFPGILIWEATWSLKDFLVIDRAPLVKNLCSSRHPLEDEWNINKQSKDTTQPAHDKCPRAREFERRGRRWLCPQYGERYSSIPVADQGRKRCFAGTYTGGQWQEGDSPQTPLWGNYFKVAFACQTQFSPRLLIWDAWAGFIEGLGELKTSASLLWCHVNGEVGRIWVLKARWFYFPSGNNICHHPFA